MARVNVDVQNVILKLRSTSRFVTVITAAADATPKWGSQKGKNDQSDTLAEQNPIIIASRRVS